jgi:hypothetical protein
MLLHISYTQLTEQFFIIVNNKKALQQLCYVTQKGSWSVLLTKYHLGDKIKHIGIGRACDMYRGEERCIQGFGGETREKEITWKTYE